ncbi:MAG: SMI1/KNR4 family protein [Sumerlaeia bacterium]
MLLSWYHVKMAWQGSRFGPSASPAAIAEAERQLGVTFPSDLRALYRHHDGSTAPDGWGYRLMTLREAAAFEASCREWFRDPIREVLGLRFLWTNDNSDYLGYCFAEPFTGHIVEMEHDGHPLSLINRGLPSLLRDLMAAVRNERRLEKWENRRDPVAEELKRWYIFQSESRCRHPRDSMELIAEKQAGRIWRRFVPSATESFPGFRDLPADFPGPGLMPGREHPADRQRVALLRQAYERHKTPDDSGRFHAGALHRAICAFLPREESQWLVPFLRDPNFFTAAQAAESLGLRKWSPAKEELEVLARDTRPNAPHAARQALDRIAPAQSLDELLRQARETDWEKELPFELMPRFLRFNSEIVVRTNHQAQRFAVRYRDPRTKSWPVIWEV